MTATGDDPAPGPDRLGVIAQYGLLAGPLLTMLDSSIVNVAVAPIAGELHTGLATVGWTVSGYLLALGVGLAGASFLARRLGTRAVYVVSLIGFTLASAGCAGAPTIELLITARVLQGLLGAPLVPLAMSMLLGGRGSARSTSPAAGMMLFLAPALGPTLGGGLIVLGGWRTVFLHDQRIVARDFDALSFSAASGWSPSSLPGASPLIWPPVAPPPPRSIYAAWCCWPPG